MANGWTQTPNFILDAVPLMRPAEVQIVMVILRQTAGWQRESISLTIGEFETLTNMARASVVTGIKDALEHGYITREEDGKSYAYRIADTPPTEPPVQKVDRQSGESVQIVDRTDDSSVQKVDCKTPKSVQKVDRQSVQKVNPIEININTNIQEQERGEREALSPTRVSHKFFDPRKFVNGMIPPGEGATPAEVFYEVHTTRDDDQVLSKHALATISEQVDDLERWREVVSVWELCSYKATNIKGQLDWYRQGIPSRASPSSNGNHSTNNGVAAILDYKQRKGMLNGRN